MVNPIPFTQQVPLRATQVLVRYVLWALNKNDLVSPSAQLRNFVRRENMCCHSMICVRCWCRAALRRAVMATPDCFLRRAPTDAGAHIIRLFCNIIGVKTVRTYIVVNLCLSSEDQLLWQNTTSE